MAESRLRIRVMSGAISRVWEKRKFAAAAVVAAVGLVAATLPAQSAFEPSVFKSDKAAPADQHAPAAPNLPPQAKQAQRFLAQRRVAPGRRHAVVLRRIPSDAPQSAGTSAWQPVGPTAVASQNYGLVTGRISALALDPSDTTGNKLYLGTTGGGVWFSQNANSASASTVEFTPLTDSLAALDEALPASISIGAITVQPGATGVILAGTGDPNDALDSYYGAGILRSADNGATWNLIGTTQDATPGSSGQLFSFAGEGFAGFAWSTANPELVVAAVSQAYEGDLVNAVAPQSSYEGLYYSTDSGATWNLATITDGNGQTVQGPSAAFALPDGNAATAVVWNPIRKLFIAAVRFHGYYQSPDGITWRRMAAQPGTNLTTQLCPTNTASVGSTSCPIFRGALAVNPKTGDTFAWTVDDFNQDQGLWRDACSISGGKCTSQSISFSQQLDTAPLETENIDGPATIVDGDYNLALSAIPFEQDTYILAGDNDLWKCSLAANCAWRDTTNATSCMSAAVGEYQHAIAWNTANPLEVFLGNDSGIWRSTDAIDESGPVCNASDASHFQNLNRALGSLAEVASLSTSGASQFTMMAGLGANGTAGVKSSSRVSDWPEIENGEGGAVAIDFSNPANWYVNNQAGVSIHRCSQTQACTPSAFGASPVVNEADVDNDGFTMTAPAAFLVDRVDPSQLLIGTCRVWRGPANGHGWSTANAVSPILDGNIGAVSCQQDALIRSMAALQTSGGNEAIYVGMYGPLDGGSTLAGHVFSATLKPGAAATPTWQDLTLNPVANDDRAMNAFGLDISSIYIDPHDLSGNTVYVTVEGFWSETEPVRQIYRSTDGGAHWVNATSNLLPFPTNSVVVDPQDASTVYVATDAGVYSTRDIASCGSPDSNCWSAFGSGLPESPVVALAAAPQTAAAHVLTAATYGRGLWQNPLWTAGEQLTTATIKPASLTFNKQQVGTESNAQTVTLTNTGGAALSAAITIAGDFVETGNCQAAPVKSGASCTLQVRFAPTATGTRTGRMTVSANVSGGQLTVALSGTATPAAPMNLTPASIDFAQVIVGSTSPPLQVTANNDGAAAVAISSVNTEAPFAIDSNACGKFIAANSSCQLKLTFSPSAPGAASGKLSMVDSAGTQTVLLSGAGAANATDTLSTASLTLPVTAIGQISAASNVVLTNSGDVPLTQIAPKIAGPFQLTSNCGTQLPARSSCAFSIEFAPVAAGAQTGTLTVTDEFRRQNVKLSGTGAQLPKFAVAPSKLKFPPRPAGSASAAMQLTISNTGGSPMAGVNLNITGASASSFEIASTTCGAGLKNGASCTAQLKFVPEETGGNAADLNVSTSTVGVASIQIDLGGVGLPPPELAVNPPQLEFDNGIVGVRSAAKTVTISNLGGSALSDLHLAISGDFSFTAGSCSAALGVGATCAAKVTFAPTSTGALNGVLTVSSLSGAATPATVSLRGIASGPATIVTSPSSLDFSKVAPGAVSAARDITVSDVGTASLKGLSLAATGAFHLGQSNCTSALTAGKECTTQVVFAPIAAGQQTGTLTAASTTQWTAPAVVALTGVGIAEPSLSAAPTQLVFGSVPVGNKGVPLPLRIENTGSGSIAGMSLKATGDFTLSSDECGMTLAAFSTCTTMIVFSPKSDGTLAGDVFISRTSAGTKSLLVPLQGVGVATGSLSVNVSNLVFADTTVGNASNPQLATVTNTSAGIANGLTFKTTGNFVIEDNTCGMSLSAGANCTMDIYFAPKASGIKTGAMTASSTTMGVGSAKVALSGTAVPAAYLSAAPQRLVFPGTTVGATSTAMALTLSNPGIAPVAGLKMQLSGDFSATLCATSLSAGATCRMNVVFKPTGLEVRAGRLTITSTTQGAPSTTVELEGAGTAPASINLNPASLNFPGTLPGHVSTAQTITVSNPGAAVLSAPNVSILGDYQLASSTCSAPLAPGASCELEVKFAPIEAGGRDGMLTVTSATTGVAPAAASLTGAGLTPTVINVSPPALAFPVVLTGQSSAPQTVTILNAGGIAISSLNLAVSQQFALTANTCGGSLLAGKSCTVGVYFKPVAQGAVAGALAVTSPSAAFPANIALSGTGGAPAAIVVAPAVINFPAVGVGQVSNSVKVTVTNAGVGVGLTGLKLKVGSAFELVNNACKPTLAQGASCTTEVVFKPSSAGTIEAALAVSASGISADNVTLQGTGFDFTLKPKGVTSLTVSSGQSAAFDLSIATLGARGSFTFTCGNLPPNSQCAFNPSSETVSVGASGYVTLQVETGLGSAAAQSKSRSRWPAWPLAAGLALLPLALRKRPRKCIAILLLAVSAAAITSCVSASGGPNTPHPSGPGVTPSATYSILVSATADKVQHSLTVSLTVD